MTRPRDIERYPFWLHELAQEYLGNIELVKTYSKPTKHEALSLRGDVYGFQKAIIAHANRIVLNTYKGPRMMDRISKVRGALTPTHAELIGFVGVKAYLREQPDGTWHVILRHGDSEALRPKEVQP